MWILFHKVFRHDIITYMEVVMNNRLIKLDSTYNFRDFGGYVGHEGKTVKKNVLYRADSLSKLTEDDVNKLESLNIRDIIDYRSDEERYNNEDVEIPNAQVHLLDPIATIAQFAGSGTGSDEFSIENITQETLINLLGEENRKFVESDRGQEVYKEMLNLVLNTEGAIVQHCTAGKDRTGYGSALVLLLLGVSKEDVIYDYLLTNESVKIKPMEINPMDIEDEALIEAMSVLQGVRMEFIVPAFKALEKYDSVEHYVIEELGFTQEDIDSLRDKYLE